MVSRPPRLIGSFAENDGLRGIIRQAFHPRHFHVQQGRQRPRRQRVGDMHVGGLAAGSRTEQDLGLGTLQLGHEGFGRYQQIRCQHQGIAVQIRMLADDVRMNTQAGNRRIPIQRDMVRAIGGTPLTSTGRISG